MHRLLQGDVGAGKTIVALLAAVVAMENGLQVAFMAPTEILARAALRDDWRACWRSRVFASTCSPAARPGLQRHTILAHVERGTTQPAWSARTRWCRTTSRSTRWGSW